MACLEEWFACALCLGSRRTIETTLCDFALCLLHNMVRAGPFLALLLWSFPWRNCAWDEENDTKEEGTTSASSSTPATSSSTWTRPSTFCSAPYTYNEYMRFMANAWDEEIAVAEQLENYENVVEPLQIQANIPQSPPPPETLPTKCWHFLLLVHLPRDFLESPEQFLLFYPRRPYICLFVNLLVILEKLKRDTNNGSIAHDLDETDGTMQMGVYVVDSKNGELKNYDLDQLKRMNHLL
ncbi:unnamed protein product [Symbiodinium sp. CCMP2592]|nr:unnamed protein product [Symbiodinium sp. CCMP2592]